MPTFDHQKLDVYRAALEFLALSNSTISPLPPGHAHLADQLRRAATSITLNIAEGAGEFSPKDKARFYRMARRSATESAAIFDVFERLELVQSNVCNDARDLLFRIVQMLTRLAVNLEERS